MASGQNCVEFSRAIPPGTLFAQEDVRAGGSSPSESLTLWDFDAGTIEYMDFECRLTENYAGGGLTFTLDWMATSATSGNVVWGIAIRRFQDDAEDIDASHTYDYNEVTDTCASASGEVSRPTVTFTNGADMDSWAAGEKAIVRVRRNATSGSDTMAGDAELWSVSGKET